MNQTLKQELEKHATLREIDSSNVGHALVRIIANPQKRKLAILNRGIVVAQQASQTFSSASRWRRFCTGPRPGTLVAAAMIALVLALTLSVLFGSAQLSAGYGANRTLSFYNINNKERVTVQFKKNGKFVPGGLKELNWVLRDWRRNEPTKMDPKLLDLIWDIRQELGAKKPIHIISAFRSLKTNNMLRRTRGGQAKRSQHILGKAMDIYFPDVPLKKLRYSALVRQQGGVGYYPTSAIPFVHVDTGRVRHWPRLPRYELALLFPNGTSLHRPVRGGPITRKDVRIAQSRHKRLAVQIASFHNRRNGRAAAILVAANTPAFKTRINRARKPVAAAAPRRRIASARPLPAPRLALKSAPRLARRTPARSTQPTATERGKLARLALAALRPEPTLLQPPRSVSRPRQRAVMGPPVPPARLASLAAATARGALNSFTGTSTSLPVDTPQRAEGWSNGWVQAPAYDEEHPDEMSYRPFPIAPLLTTSASADDPALIQLTHPDAVKTLDLLDGIDTIPPLQFRPGAGVARLLLSQRFTGKAVDLNALYGRTSPAQGTGRTNNALKRRRVTTQDG